MQRTLDRQKARGGEDQIYAANLDSDEEPEEQSEWLGIDGQVKARVTLPPSLKNLLYNIEAANSHPQKALYYLKKLSKDADQLVDKLDILEINFTTGLDDDEIEENIETFMQNAQLVIDNHFELQSLMLTVLAKLSIVRNHDFGLHCFCTLKDLMNSGKEMETQVMHYLKIEVISKMKQHDPTAIPVGLLRGLHELIEDSSQRSLLSGLYESSFPQWLRLYNEKIDFCKKQNTQMGDHDHYDAIIQLISVSVTDEEDDENVQRLLDQDLCKYITIIIKNSTWIHRRYLPCLNLITTLASANNNVADRFMDTYIQTNLLNHIRKSLNVYKKTQSLVDEHSKVSAEQQKLKYQTFAAEIVTLGALLKSQRSENRMKILEEVVVIELIDIMSHERTDPLLLTAICRFALDLFQTNEVRLNAAFMENFFQGIASMKQILPYLGFDKYPDLLQMAKKYHFQLRGGKQDDKDSDDSDDPRESLKVSAAAGKSNIHIVSSLSHLSDPIVCELFIRIINLIEFFCRQAVENEQNNLFSAIAENLNNDNREAALFNCLMVPNDEVRLTVVRCLFVVPEDQLDSEELSQLCSITGSCTNIEAGQTELVLSTIYWILTKLVLGDPNEDQENVYKTFQTQFGDQAVNEALGILQRNSARIELGEEDEEKYALSLSIINFLKASSKAPLMLKYLKQKNAICKKILINEDLFSSDQVKLIPIDIENTCIGRDINCLMDTISGISLIQPYGDVAVRVLMRMADILQSRHFVDVFHIDQSMQDVTEGLTKFHKEMYKRKKQRELQYWVDKPQTFLATHVEDLTEF